MQQLPFYIYFIFGLAVLAAIILFYRAAGHSNKFLMIVSAWILFQAIVSLCGFYKITDTRPPRALLMILPSLIGIIACFITKSGKKFIEGLSTEGLTIFHIIRIPVELTLFLLFARNVVPGLMTFSGRNFDIFSGITAPFIYYFGFVQKKLSRQLMIIWNFVCFALVINVAIDGILSIPGRFQHFAFDHPNIAVLHFPFVLLPAVLVPLVILAHLASLKKLFGKQTAESQR